jgi:peptidoglycan-N-acetylglucosamine deacetylase
MSVTTSNLPKLKEQLDAVNARCKRFGISRPISFAYPGNAIAIGALEILKTEGFIFARRGGAPEFPYKEGRGFAYEPKRDHPLLIPTAGDARPDWTISDFKRAVDQAKEGRVVVLQFHGVPDLDHPWVHTPPERFREYMNYLREERYPVIALRDLARFVEPGFSPENPLAIIEERKRMLQQVPPRIAE